jgi:hypothetical protein
MFFDNGNVAAPALSTEEINYVLDTVFPYNRISLQVDTLDFVYTNAVIWTSIDNRNWQMVERSDGARNKFFQVISGSNGNTKLFIKISYDRADSRENRIKIFGIKKIEVNGELSTNERAR